ncbi:MAG: GNAT family N-acetyltransferase [Candidatus Fimivivens sp.]
MIRKVTPSDRETYVGLAQKFYNSDAVDHDIPTKYIEATFDELMRADIYAEGYLMTHDGKAVGYALIAKTFSCEGGGLTVWVEEVFILPEYRSLGLGKALFAVLEERYSGSLARMRLEIAPDNRRAKNLYQRLGFRELAYRQMVKAFK